MGEIKGSKGMETMVLFSVVLFLGLLAFFSSQLFFTTTSDYSSFTNQSNSNLTVITIGSDFTKAQLCDWHVGIIVVDQIVGGADCIADYVGFLFGFSSASTGINWLTPIIIAMIGVLIYIGIRLLKPGS